MAEELEKKNMTVFGAETEFDGKLSFTDNLIIEGKFNGTIEATGNLTIEQGAYCTSDSISVNSLIVLGTVKSDITAKDKVEMCSGSKVVGDIVTSRVRIAKNVEFDGNITMIDKMPESDLFNTASKEFRDAFVLYSQN